MVNKNDERIMRLRAEIDERRKALAKKPALFHPVTNCLLTLHGVTYNLHVNTTKLLLVKLNALKLSAEDLGISTEEIPISGYPLDCWIADVQNYLQAQQYKQEKANLCEKNHKTLQKAEYEEVYRSQNSVPDGWPTKIRVKVRNGDYIVYRR